MFLTVPANEWPVPLGLAPDGGKCWEALEVSTRTPWFLVTTRLEASGVVFMLTTAIAWETTLLAFVGKLPVESIEAIQMVAPCSTGVGEWVFRRVTAMWFAEESEMTETGPLIFSFADCGDVYDSHQRKVNHPKWPRELLFQRRS